MSSGTKRSYWYTTDKLTFTSLQTGVPATIAIASPMDFVWVSGFYVCDNAAVQAGNDTTFGGFLLQRVQTSDQDSMIKKPTPLSAIFGTGGLGPGPNVQPYIMRVASNATIELTIDNLIAGSANLYITFIGFQWPVGAALPAPYVA